MPDDGGVVSERLTAISALVGVHCKRPKRLRVLSSRWVVFHHPIESTAKGPRRLTGKPVWSEVGESPSIRGR